MFTNTLQLGKAREHVFCQPIHNPQPTYPQPHPQPYKSYPQSYPQTHTPILYYLALVCMRACTMQHDKTTQQKHDNNIQQHNIQSYKPQNARFPVTLQCYDINYQYNINVSQNQNQSVTKAYCLLRYQTIDITIVYYQSI